MCKGASDPEKLVASTHSNTPFDLPAASDLSLSGMSLSPDARHMVCSRRESKILDVLMVDGLKQRRPLVKRFFGPRAEFLPSSDQRARLRLDGLFSRLLS